MGPHPKPPSKAVRKIAAKVAAKTAAKTAAKARELAKLKNEMNPKPKPPVQKGTHWHEPEEPSRLHPEAQWIKDNGWT